MSLEIYIPNIVVNMVLTQGSPGLESWGRDEDEADHAGGEVLKNHRFWNPDRKVRDLTENRWLQKQA